MKKNKTDNAIPSFPFDSASRSAGSLIFNYFSLLRGRVKLWENAHFVFIDVPLEPAEANKILPAWMFLRKPYRATFFIADYPKTAFTVPYHEAALLLHIRTPCGAGVHCPWMIVDDDTALIYGREMLGYPKKMGEFHFTERGKTISADMTRRGVRLVSVKTVRKETEKNPRPLMGVKTFNIGAMGQFVAFNPIWLFKPIEKIHASYTATAELRIGNSPHDPIRKLIADYRNPLPARIGRIDILGSRYLLPVGMTGLRVYANSYENRFR